MKAAMHPCMGIYVGDVGTTHITHICIYVCMHVCISSCMYANVFVDTGPVLGHAGPN